MPSTGLKATLSAFVGALLAVSLPAAAAPAPKPAMPAATRVVAVVELFQSQGCSSCPPANANVMALIGKPGVLALSWGVTYWDFQGWTDTFASQQFTQRQRDYARGLRHDNVFTPQVVVNGRVDGTGIDAAALSRMVAQGAEARPGPAIQIVPGLVSVASGAAPASPADVWLVRYDPRIVQVPIARGENSGRTLPHRNVVRELVRLGAWRGAAISLPVPRARQPGLRAAVLVQGAAGGPILSAATL